MRTLLRPLSRWTMSAALPLACVAPQAHAAFVNVYLMAGQSNMQGLGTVSALTTDQKAAPANTYFWTGSTFQTFVPGVTYTAGNTPLTSRAEFGPEVAFAASMASPTESTYLIKSYRGGTALDAGWADQTYVGGTGVGRYNFYAGTSATDPNRGLSYISMMSTFQTALQNIVARGDTPVVKGMIWMQGEQDTKNSASAAAYAANLQLFVNRVRQDIGVADMPFVYGQAAPSGELPGETPVAAYVYRDQLRASQASAASLITGSAMVSTDGYPTLSDHAHYTTAGQLRLGADFATAMKSLQAVPEPAEYASCGVLAVTTAALVRRRQKRRRAA